MAPPNLTRFIGRFVEEARDHLGRLGDGLSALERNPTDAELVNATFRSAHTIKGSSRMLKLLTITETAHRMEDVLGPVREGKLAFTPAIAGLLLRGVDALSALVDTLAVANDPGALPPPDEALCAALAAAAGGGAPAAEEAPAPPPTPPAASPAAAAAPVKGQDTVRVRLAKLDELVKLQGEVVSSHARLRQRLRDVQALVRGAPEPPAGAEGAAWSAHTGRLRQFANSLRDDVLAQERLMDELHNRALVMRMLPLSMVFDGAGRTVRDLARSIGKDAECVVTGAEIELDRNVIDLLADPIVHLLRNAVDHGLEPPAARLAAGKPARGRITLSARQDGGWVVIEISDDGGGVSCQSIRDKAVRKGLLSAEKAAALGDRDALDLIFLPGFSTSAIITDISGRGVGLDVVKRTIVDELQGAVGVDSRPGGGTSFTLRLPLSLAVMRILLVGAGGAPYAFTAQHVAELVQASADARVLLAGRPMVVVRNEFVPVASLAALINAPTRASEGDGAGPLVVLRVRNDKLALQVDELLDERDMVMKPLPDHMRRFPLVSGMVTTGRNELVSVLHGPALLDLARQARFAGVAAEAREPEAGTAPRVLVVDDSLNTREIEKDVLEACGFRVTLAEDGLDGLGKALAGEPFDAVLTDVEMPNMDGFTLTARLRQEDAYRTRPIVIVTSRAKDEDKRRGIQVGANAYIVKGDFDQGILVDTLRSLLG